MAFGPMVTFGRMIALKPMKTLSWMSIFADGIELDVVGTVEHGDRAIVANEGTGGEVDVIAYANVCRVSEDGCREDTAVLANLAKIAMAAEIFGVFSSRRLAKLAVETGEFAVTPGKYTDDFLKKRAHSSYL